MPPGGMPDPSSHYSFWAGMLLKTICSQGETEMGMPLGESRPCQQPIGQMFWPRGPLWSAPLGGRHLLCLSVSLEVELLEACGISPLSATANLFHDKSLLEVIWTHTLA